MEIKHNNHIDCNSYDWVNPANPKLYKKVESFNETEKKWK